MSSVPWSEQIQQRYRCVLAGDICEWFDQEIWKHADDGCGQRFLHAVPPQELLDDTPQAIWPALMPCDFLPIISNGLGDYLCLRFGSDNRSREFVHWYHGGGDWIPWGDSLTEALFFDSVRQNLPGGQRDHALAAAFEPAVLSDNVHPVDRWVRQRISDREGAEIESDDGRTLADMMLSGGLSEIAVRCQLCIDAIENPLLHELDDANWRMIDPQIRQRYLFDCDLLPDDVVGSISVKATELAAVQDWPAVASHCESIAERRSDLAWVWDLWGYSLERSGNAEHAIECYRKSLLCSIFTDQTVRIRTHAFVNEGQKFSASRLLQLGYKGEGDLEANYLTCLAESSPDVRRKRVRELFERLASTAEPPEAYDAWMKAGWDLGAEPMSAYGKVLDRVAESAAAAGYQALTEMAKTHRACFEGRYGL
ncbi:SMI1/KNR4 family protein [Roseiconus lacunae]|uniref:SMI1/KNR4 family protein n=1 Tax=Roseiconus lacunae TaxID=2605694 RepID=A0ABT7PCT2_9BACT|nr:SMI1/KNR4 family protein [Roseiconus lacunae]MDM4014308.1 SMI1/KNR4 family protein [Roseiconus lacunae]